MKYRQNNRMLADAMMTLENGSGHQITRQPGEEADGDEEDDDDGSRGVGGANLLAVHLQQMAARRMMQAGLTKGWQTWLDGWLEQQRQKRMLAAAAGRLLRPKLAAAVVSLRREPMA